MMKTILCLIVLLLSVQGCGENQKTTVMGFKSKSMQQCLESIKKQTGSSLDIIRDTPEIVTGKLNNGETFACEVKSTGTEGVYIEGWWMVKTPKQQ